VAGLCPNPLGELTALPQITQLDSQGRVGWERGKRRDGEGRGEMGKGGIGPPTMWLLPPLMHTDLHGDGMMNYVEMEASVAEIPWGRK